MLEGLGVQGHDRARHRARLSCEAVRGNALDNILVVVAKQR